jgi:hypothetical protein
LAENFIIMVNVIIFWQVKAEEDNLFATQKVDVPNQY